MNYYLFAILPNICILINVLTTICVFCGVITTVCILYYHVDHIDDFKIFKKIGKIVYPVLVLLLLLATFVPSQKQLAFIIAAPYIVENKDLQQAGKNTGEIIKLGTEYLKEVLHEKKTVNE